MLDQKKIHVIAEPAKKANVHTIAVEVDQAAPFYLHSRYNPLEEAQDWLTSIEITANTAYIVLGFGIGYHVRALLDVIDADSTILIVEPFQETSLVNITPQCMKDVTWLSDKRLQFVAFFNLRDVSVDISDILGDRQLYKVVICPHFPSMQIYPDFYKSLYDKLQNEIANQFYIKTNFGLLNTTFLYKNAWNNLPEIVGSPGIKEFQNKFYNKPAIIVGSGPSLNKNINVLRECSENILVVACGSAMRALSRNNVRPHIFASADPFPAVYESLQDYLSDQALLLSTYDTCHELVHKYPGDKVFAETQGIQFLQAIQPYLPPTGMLRKSISVTTTALDFAIYMGCNPVIFVGQDCALSLEENRYVEGLETYFTENPDDYFDVPGQNGQTLKAPPDLRDILVYLQNMIDAHPHITFINATEGGAFIKGAQHMKLSDVYHQYGKGCEAITTIKAEVTYSYNSGRLLAVLADIRKEAEMLKPALDNNDEIDFPEFAKKLNQSSGYRYIRPVIDPFILYCKFKANEQGANLEVEKQAVREKCLNLVETLINAIDSVTHQLQGKKVGKWESDE